MVDVIGPVGESRSYLTNVESKRIFQPLLIANLTTIGSKSVCGRSTCRQGDAASYSPFRSGWLPHEWILANSSPAIVRHQRVCCIQSPDVAFFMHSASRPISRKHSNAAGFVMCARGSFDVPEAFATTIPMRPCWARKHARLAPAGPAPTIRNGVSITFSCWSGDVGRLPLTVTVLPVNNAIKFCHSR